MTGTSSTPRATPILALIMAATFVVGCTANDDVSSGETASTDTSSDDPPSGDAVEDDKADTPIGDCETIVTTPDIEYRTTSELTDAEVRLIELFRNRSASILVEQNPESCQGLVEVSSRVEADEFGAFEVKSFAHADPEVRYDLFYFTERQAIDATTQEDITTRLSALREPDTSLRVWTVANTLFLAVTAPTDDEAAAAITGHYNQIIAGEE